MLFSNDQIAQISNASVQDKAALLKQRVDAQLPDETRNQSIARLTALGDLIMKDVRTADPAGPLLELEINQTLLWLQRVLESGVAYREARAAALLHGSAALGAMWFVDDRLLSEEDKLPILRPPDDPLAALMSTANGARFKLAARRERELRAGVLFNLPKVLADTQSPELLQTLLKASFSPARSDEPAMEEAEETQEAGTELAGADLSPDAAQSIFMQREQSLMAQSGIDDRELQALCLAGDLAFGLGRCVRLVSQRQDKLDGADLKTWLKGALNDLAGFR